MNNIPSIPGQSDLLSDINKVEQRIREIQEQFNVKPVSSPDGISFQQTLAKQLEDKTGSGYSPSSSGSISGTGEKSVRTNTENAAPQQISDMIKKAADKYGVDARLLSAIAETESDYKPDAVSSAGAVGVMQLMPDTAASLGVTNPYDAQQNIEGGAKYLKELLKDFGGDVREAVAAYNAGPQAVKKYQGVPPYSETQNYVSHVLDLYQ